MESPLQNSGETVKYIKLSSATVCNIDDNIPSQEYIAFEKKMVILNCDNISKYYCLYYIKLKVKH